MKIKFLAAAITLLLLLAGPGHAQIYDTNNDEVHTFAGFGLPACVDGQGVFSAFSSPSQIVADTAGNLYVVDNGNARIRKVAPDATVTTLVGGGTYLEGYGTNVSLAWSTPGALAIDHANQLWLVMGGSYGSYSYLLSIGTNGYVTLRNGGLTNLTATSSLCFDSANNLYYSGGNRIYRYNPASGLVQAFAGNGVAGNFDGQGAVFTAFYNPAALASDQADNLYVWDSGNGTVRRIDQGQNVSTLAGLPGAYETTDGQGTNATFAAGINALFTDRAGNLYLVSGSCVRKMDAQTNVVTLAGTFYQVAFADGPGYLARFYNAEGGCFSQGQIFVADTSNNRIRSISLNATAQVVSPAALQLNTYPGLQITGTVGRTYQIQASPDLNAWAPVTSLLLTSSPFLWIDQNPVSGAKYYRAVLLP